MPFVLTKGQSDGLFKIRMSESHIVIMGPAGTGKTFLLRSFLDDIRLDTCAFCAPTHAAKRVLEDTINSGKPEHERISAHTIHSLLKIHPETYEDQVIFDPNGDIPDLGDLKYLVVDEVSMTDGLLFGRIMSAATKYNIRVIGLGDPYQLQPVKAEGCHYKEDLGLISPMFFDSRFERVILTEIVRQAEGNPIIQVATDIRKFNKNIIDCRDPLDSTIGVFNNSNIASMLAKYMAFVKSPKDTMNYKLMAYTNKDVDNLNTYVRRKLFNTDQSVVVGEYLVMQEPVMANFMGQEQIVFHNGQTCVVDSIEEDCELVDTIKLPRLFGNMELEDAEPDEYGMKPWGFREYSPIEVRYWRITLTTVDMLENEKITHTIDIIKDDESKRILKDYMEIAAEIYKDKGREIEAGDEKPHQKKVKKKLLWAKYWELKNRFIDTKGSAACTIHKSQGATFDGAFIFSSKINDLDFHLKRQLRYVAVTRARKFVEFV